MASHHNLESKHPNSNQDQIGQNSEDMQPPSSVGGGDLNTNSDAQYQPKPRHVNFDRYVSQLMNPKNGLISNHQVPQPNEQKGNKQSAQSPH